MIEFITIFMAFLAGVFAKCASADKTPGAWPATGLFLGISIAVAVWGAYQ